MRVAFLSLLIILGSEVPVLASSIINWNGVARSSLSTACQEFIDTAMTKNEWDGGFLEVPEDDEIPTGEKIHVFYYHNHVSSIEQSSAIVFLNGGPFSSYHNRMEALKTDLQQFDVGLKHLFVMIDQRGTGCSIPNMPTSESSRDFKKLKLYTSKQVILDAEAIRKLLIGDRSWKIFAQSYGGVLLARYLELAPRSITEIHAYAPALFSSMSDFYFYRLKKQKDVIDRFLLFYQKQGVDLKPVFKLLRNEAQNYCLHGICGLPLLDSILTNIGQGMGRSAGSTEIWDAAKGDLMALMNAKPRDVDDPNWKKFSADVSAGTDFFNSLGHLMVDFIWWSEVPSINLNEDRDCADAYGRLRAISINPEELNLNECRIIKSFGSLDPHTQVDPSAQVPTGQDNLDQFYVRNRLRQLQAMKKNIPFSLYTGELDTLVQSESLRSLSEASDVVIYHHFMDSGHAGWLWQSLVWTKMLEN